MARYTIEIRKRLDWPEGWARCPDRREAAFDTSYDRAVADLREQIRMLGGEAPLLTHNPYRDGRDPSDPGAAVYFTMRGEGKVFACDRWYRMRDNVRAIGKTIEALRGLL